MTDYALIIAALGIAGFFKGLVGMGLPPIAMGLLVLFLSPVEAAAIMVLPALLTNMWQAFVGSAFMSILSRFWLMLLFTALGTLVFAGALQSQAEAAVLLLGGLLVGYGLYSLRAPTLTLKSSDERWLAPFSGFATGMVTAFTGVSSMPSVPFLQAAGLTRDDLVQAMGLSFLVSALALIAALGISGGLLTVPAMQIVAASLSAIACMQLGSRFRKHIDDVLFRKLILWTLIGLGLLLLGRSAQMLV